MHFLLRIQFQTRVTQWVCTFEFALWCLIVLVGGFVVGIAHTQSSLLSSVTIILINILVITKLLTRLESHQSQTTFVASSYLKVTAIRWTNTAIVTLVLVPFTDVLEKGKLLKSVFTLFTLEITLKQFLQMIDWMGHLKRHVFAPRQPDQRRSKFSVEVNKFLLEDFFHNCDPHFSIASSCYQWIFCFNQPLTLREKGTPTSSSSYSSPSCIAQYFRLDSSSQLPIFLYTIGWINFLY